jgi:hypothetical protein
MGPMTPAAEQDRTVVLLDNYSVNLAEYGSLTLAD